MPRCSVCARAYADCSLIGVSCSHNDRNNSFFVSLSTCCHTRLPTALKAVLVTVYGKGNLLKHVSYMDICISFSLMDSIGLNSSSEGGHALVQFTSLCEIAVVTVPVFCRADYLKDSLQGLAK